MLLTRQQAPRAQGLQCSQFYPGEEMVTPSSVLSWEIMWTRSLAGISNFVHILIFFFNDKKFLHLYWKSTLVLTQVG